MYYVLFQSSCYDSGVRNPTGIHEVVCLIRGLAQWVKDLALSCAVGHRHGSDPVLLWLWCRPVARAPIQTPSLGTFICLRSGLRNGKKTNNKIK